MRAKLHFLNGTFSIPRMRLSFCRKRLYAFRAFSLAEAACTFLLHNPMLAITNKHITINIFILFHFIINIESTSLANVCVAFYFSSQLSTYPCALSKTSLSHIKYSSVFSRSWFIAFCASFAFTEYRQRINFPS